MGKRRREREKLAAQVAFELVGDEDTAPSEQLDGMLSAVEQSVIARIEELERKVLKCVGLGPTEAGTAGELLEIQKENEMLRHARDSHEHISKLYITLSAKMKVHEHTFEMIAKRLGLGETAEGNQLLPIAIDEAIVKLQQANHLLRCRCPGGYPTKSRGWSSHEPSCPLGVDPIIVDGPRG